MLPPLGCRPTKRGLEFNIGKNHISTLDLYFKEAELLSIIESSGSHAYIRFAEQTTTPRDTYYSTPRLVRAQAQ
eukprot:3006-Heterocapsa_arctica.AAC.1